MRKIIYASLLALTLTSYGCCSVPPEAKTQASDNTKITDAYIVLMQAGKTTPAQDQKFIRANRRSWYAQNYALNSEKPPADLQQPGQNGPLDANLIQALESDTLIRAHMKKLEEILKNSEIAPVGTK